MTQNIKIDSLGAQGDGIAIINGKPRHIPFTLPNEEIHMHTELGTTAFEIITTSPDRVEPACPHFGTCGGCALQHLSNAAYNEWKRQKVEDALAQRGIEIKVDPVLHCEIATRRRTQFAARRTEAGLRFGYHAKASKEIVEIDACPILIKDIQEAIPRIAKLASLACPAKGELKLSVFQTGNGLDVSLSGPNNLSDSLRQKLIKASMDLDFIRLSLDDEILIERVKPMISFDGILASVPPGSFSQATHAAQEQMIDLVTTYLKKCKSVADLFCGSGTFALPLARQSKVLAVEFEEGAVKSLDEAMRRAENIKTFTIERRDLFRRPIFAKELKRIDGLVFDPPRAGAEMQAKEIAKSGVKHVVAVSCNPATFARDARILIDGGFTLQKVTPVDQFLYSAHIEIVAYFTSPGKKASGLMSKM